MIAIKRVGEIPNFSSFDTIVLYLRTLREFYDIPANQRKQRKTPGYNLSRNDTQRIKSLLQIDFNGKCAYCEQLMSPKAGGSFDHFRPNASARGTKDEFSPEHYWTLAFEWKNMYLCCEACNRFKLTWFPVDGPRAELDKNFEAIVKSEKNLLVDPCHDSPENEFSYNEGGVILPLSKRAKITIDILKLNRKELIDQRKKKVDLILSLLSGLSLQSIYNLSRINITDSVRELGKSVLDRLFLINSDRSNQDFIGIQRFFYKKILLGDEKLRSLLKHIDKTKKFSTYIAKISKTPVVVRPIHRAAKITVPKPASFSKKTAPKKAARKPAAKEDSRKQSTKSKPAVRKKTKESLNRFSIESIEIENFKSIENLTIKFPGPNVRQESWLMLLGENGVGKSSFLQAVTLALMGETYRKKIKIEPGDILNYNATQGLVRINQFDTKPIELRFDEHTIKNSMQKATGFLLAYGSTRLFPTAMFKPEVTKGRVRAKNMFNPETALFADSWLVSLHGKSKKLFNYAARALKDLLSSEFKDRDIKLSVRKNQVWLDYSDPQKRPDSLRVLSDGYKSVIALLCDIMQALLQGNTNMEVAEGIVLLDEIGTHLHPRWKMRIVTSFRRAFPRVQFISTTHDPLCLKGLNEGEIAVFKKNKEGQVYSVMNLPDPGEFRADQLLTSRFFGLNSTVDEEVESLFDEYYSLLGKQEHITDNERKRLDELKNELRDKKHLGSSLREELALTAADELLADELTMAQNSSLSQLKEETRNKLQIMWNRVDQ